MRSSSYVFGKPIKNEDLQKDKLRFDRATEALKRMREGHKDLLALDFADNTKAPTRIIFYNATGDPISFLSSHDWNGGSNNRSTVYVSSLENGQWGVIVRGADSHGRDSGAAMYRLKKDDQDFCDWMFCWEKQSLYSDPKVYNEIRGLDESFPGWDTVRNRMKRTLAGNPQTDQQCGYTGTITTAEGDGIIYLVAIITMDGVNYEPAQTLEAAGSSLLMNFPLRKSTQVHHNARAERINPTNQLAETDDHEDVERADRRRAIVTRTPS